MKDHSQCQPDWDTLMDPDRRESWSGLLFADVPPEAAAQRLAGRLCYLATPYSKLVLNYSGEWDVLRSLNASCRASLWAAKLARVGVTAVSPIVCAAEMVHLGEKDQIDPLDDLFWERWCRPLLGKSDAVVVPPIEGWRESVGVWREVMSALSSSRGVWVLKEAGS